ncbi:MAG: hypothetical protein IPN91_01465 [Holophagaceae bacterium]|uniref:Ankyrin repeat domain-containing protein n=1 Tax=Candidatus Geothrix odensensis TaxID=2954440 RepID=A0A936F005_9BACT|nr:hypothetical protein [Candidatus Geothrix odensensis]
MLIGAIALSLLFVLGCSPRPLFWNTLYKGDHEDYYSSRFLVAAADGDLDYIRKHLREHPNPDDDRGDWGSTALALASSRSHHSIIEILLEHGANPDEAVPHGTPVSISIFSGDKIAFDLLLKHSKPNYQRSDGLSYLHMACSYLNPKDDAVNHFVSALLRTGLDPNHPYPDGNLPLIHLIGNQRELAIITVLQHRADPNRSNAKGISPKSEASRMVEVAEKTLARSEQRLREFDSGEKSIWSRADLVNYISWDQEKLARSKRILALVCQ